VPRSVERLPGAKNGGEEVAFMAEELAAARLRGRAAAAR
jgi:hypothetical protein